MQPLLPSSNSLWDAVCQTASGYVIAVDLEGTIQSVNRTEDGRPVDELIGRSIHDFATHESQNIFLAVLADVFSTGAVRQLETSGKTITGEIACYAVRVGPILVDGRIEGAMICADDILPLKTSEENLRHERHVLRQLLDIQERERRLISYEIHDGFAQSLAGAIMHLQALEHANTNNTSLTKEDRHNLTQSVKLIRSSVAESRRLIAGLRPTSLDELGIVAAIESIVVEAQGTIQSVDFSHRLPADRLVTQLETTIFRIVQECLTNIRKHAAAKNVKVSLEQVGDQGKALSVRIHVQDDGIGFDPNRVPEDRFGLEGIRQRARLLKCEPVIRSAPGKGTTVEVCLPMLFAAMIPPLPLNAAEKSRQAEG